MRPALALDFDFDRAANPRRLALAYIGAAIAVIASVVAIVHVVAQPSSTSATSQNTTNAARAPASAGANLATVSNGYNGAPLVLVSGNPMFPLPGGDVLTSWDKAPVVAQGIPVQQITSAGFWAGNDETQRVFVSVPPSAIENGALSLDKLSVGELVNLSGYMAKLPDNFSYMSLDPGTISQATQQGEWVAANDLRKAA
jgi:hypothetical protein